MCSNKIILVACLSFLLGGSCPTTTTTFVAAMSMSNPDFDHLILRVSNTSQPFTTMSEERIAMDLYTYAFLNYSIGDTHFTFEEEKARYGEGKIASVQGKLVHISNADDINDDYACTTNILGTRGTPTPPAGTDWIALVRRGRCTFEEKVKNVYEKGAYGVIIYNDKPVMNLEKMQIKGKSRNITAVITYQDIGLDMAHRVDQGNDVYCIIKEGRSGMRPINTLNRTSVLFVSISFIVLMVISLVWLIFYYIQRFRYLQTKDQQSRQLCSVTKKAIMKIPTKTGKNCDEKDMDSDCCAICIEAYKASDCIRVLPCKHEFHKNCIDPWLIEHRTCPMCKLDVLKFYGYVFIGSEESIFEFEAERNPNELGNNGNSTTNQNVNSTQTNQATNGPLRNGGVLGDLIRSRDFVIEFPRIFVLDAGSNVDDARTALFPTRLPERSQSSLSLAHTKDWMSLMTNKLEEQQGHRRMPKPSLRYEMQENLLGIRMDSVKKRRSRSADGRYSNGFFARKELVKQQQNELQNEASGYSNIKYIKDGKEGTITGQLAILRRNSNALHELTDASYAQSRQRYCEHFGSKRNSILGYKKTEDANQISPSADITIQINGEGVKFEE